MPLPKNFPSKVYDDYDLARGVANSLVDHVEQFEVMHHKAIM